MRCVEFKDLLDDYCRGHLDESQSGRMAEHLSLCEICAADYREHQELLSLLEHEPKLNIAPGTLDNFLPEVWASIEKQNKVRIRGWLYKLVPPLATAALLFFLMFRPSINTSSVGTDDLAYLYAYVGQDSVATDSTYYSLLDDVFGDEDEETLELMESVLYSDNVLFSDSYLDLENLSDEGLDKVNEQINELINKAG